MSGPDLDHLAGPGRMSITRLRVLKLAALARHPNYWRAFATERVLATSEFARLPFLPGIRTVLDVGANRGQFALFARERFAGAMIHMFEPVAAAAETACRVVPTATMHEMALGSSDGTIEFHVHPDSDQSSVLPIEGAVSTEVPVARLDSLELELKSRVLLKMDVQGFELGVLRGASGIMDRVDQVLCEVSVDGYLDGAPSGDEIVAHLATLGFSPLATGPVLSYGTDVLFGRGQP